MSMAWETTVDDVQLVLDAHDVPYDEDKLDELHNGLDHDEIEDRILAYTDMDDQTAAMMSYIEDEFISEGIVPAGPKKFNLPD